MKINYRLIVFVLSVSALWSCNDYLDVDVSKSKIINDIVFSDDITATAAVNGIYSTLLSTNQSYASGDARCISSLCALSSDEFNYYPTNFDFDSFENNDLLPENQNILTLWKSAYNVIYQTNSVLEGLANSDQITTSTGNQLKGEALFLRSFTYFYLINLFGDVPLIETTNYKENSLVSRVSSSLVYERITLDLEESISLLDDDYITTERVRVNKSVALAFLARVYLYLEDWNNAEITSSRLINNNDYSILENLNSVFLANSNEAIWQLKPNVPSRTTNEGYYLILTGTPNSTRPYKLTDNLINSFESGDLRLVNWINTRTSGGNTFYYAYKYKIRTETSPRQEYSVVLRLAEQYLIRAEVRAKLGNLIGAISDIDMIRSRAGLNSIAVTNPNISQEDLLLVIEHERRVELFSEWGHRWFDLKRTGRASLVLEPLKPNFATTDLLYPIPQDEFDKNPQLGDQNLGY